MLWNQTTAVIFENYRNDNFHYRNQYSIKGQAKSSGYTNLLTHESISKKHTFTGLC